VPGAALALGTRDNHFAADREVPLQGAHRANYEHVAHTALSSSSRTSAAAGAPMLMRAKAQGTPDAF
jgi:hypothetical protein